MSGWIKLLGPSLLLGAACVLPAAAAPGTYETVLGPTPINHTTKTSLLGEGAAVATLTGSTLKISGTFQGMSGAASDAHIMMGEAIGIPGNPILDLTTTAAPNGSISGTFKLNKGQLAALRAGKLYIQINSSVGPAPGGNLWGWLLPEHVKAGQDEPQMGDWFLPQGEGLRAGRNGTKS
ncbi:MAG: CHRD domain-containing protein [Alphaproteobacteria bacterium]